jgi:hypothetical protein
MVVQAMVRVSHALELRVDLGHLLVVFQKLLHHAPVREGKHLETETSGIVRPIIFAEVWGSRGG